MFGHQIARRLLQVLLTLAGSAMAMSSWGQSAQQVDVTNQVTLTRSGLVLNRSTNTFDSTVVITAKSNAIPAPISYVITGIAPASVTLANASGTTPGGMPFVNVPVNGGTLVAGQSATIVLKFANPSRVKFSFIDQVLGGAAEVGRIVQFVGPLPIPIAAIEALPRNPNTGRPIALSLPQGTLEVDVTRRDPITAVGACTNWIAACYEPGIRELDDCARSAPSCATETPWLESGACCPTACFAQYRSARLSGTTDLEALLRVYVRQGSCFPQYQGLR